MSASQICKALARFLWWFAVILMLPLAIALLYDFVLEKPYFKTTATFAFLQTMGVCLLIACVLNLLGRKAAKRPLLRREGILFVALIWLLTTAIASLPFQFTGAIPHPIDAYYETMSGLTTTGASIIYPKAYDPVTQEEVAITLINPVDPMLSYTFYGTVPPLRDPQTGAVIRTGVEALGKPLLFWRSFLQWIGGIGIVVLFISVLPALGLGGKFLYESEMPGLTKEGMVPHIRKTAEAIWKLYVVLTGAQILLHIATDPSLSLFDAAVLSFSTISTGGFCAYNEGLGAFAGSGVGWIMGLFMFLAGISFAFYYYAYTRQWRRLKDPEFYTYSWLAVLGSALMAWALFDAGLFSWIQTYADAPFQAISALTTSGFSLTNYDSWPMNAQLLMLFLMFIGGMSGSAVGGLKVIRSLIVVRVIFHKIKSLFRPEAAGVIRVGYKDISHKTEISVFAFVCVLVGLVIVGTYLLMLDHLDPFTAFGVVATSVTNTGLCFAGIGSQNGLAYLSPFSKILSLVWMLLGRLEFFTLLVLFLPSFWKNKQ